jgi:hypothetical protein
MHIEHGNIAVGGNGNGMPFYENTAHWMLFIRVPTRQKEDLQPSSYRLIGQRTASLKGIKSTSIEQQAPVLRFDDFS